MQETSHEDKKKEQTMPRNMTDHINNIKTTSKNNAISTIQADRIYSVGQPLPKLELTTVVM